MTAEMRCCLKGVIQQGYLAWRVIGTRAVRIVLLAFAIFTGHTVQAQTIEQVTNNTTGAITDLSCNQPVASQIVRTFNITDHYTVQDVDIGINLTHTYRADLRMILRAPNNTVRNIAIDDGGSGDNWNDIFDDEAAGAIGTHNGTATDTLSPIYGHSIRPDQTFTNFDNIDAFGTWTLTICDDAGVDIGTFNQATLFLTRAKLTVIKSSTVVSDLVSVSNPKAHSKRDSPLLRADQQSDDNRDGQYCGL